MKVPIVHPYAGAFSPGFLLMDDNVRPHSARVVDQYLEQEGKERMDLPTRSPGACCNAGFPVAIDNHGLPGASKFAYWRIAQNTRRRHPEADSQFSPQMPGSGSCTWRTHTILTYHLWEEFFFCYSTHPVWYFEFQVVCVLRRTVITFFFNFVNSSLKKTLFSFYFN